MSENFFKQNSYRAEQEKTPHNVLTGLSGVSFEHPSDRLMLQALKSIPGIDKILTFLIDKYVRFDELAKKSNSLEVNEETMPELYELYVNTTKILDFENPPPLYIMDGLSINAYTTGVDQPFIVLTKGSVSLLNKEELIFIMGHELGHIICDHVLYKVMAENFKTIAAAVAQSTMGIGGPLMTALQIPLLMWFRRAELSSDRCGLLACQNYKTAITTFAKMSGLPLSDYDNYDADHLVKQTNQFFEQLNDSDTDKIFTMLDVLDESHPRAVWRVKELFLWIESGDYDDLRTASPDQRGHLNNMLGNDPFINVFMEKLIKHITIWTTEVWNIDNEESYNDVRRMLKLGAFPKIKELNNIYVIEVELDWITAKKLDLTVEILVLIDGSPKKHKIRLEDLINWEDVPKEAREQFIKTGKQKIKYILYRKEK